MAAPFDNIVQHLFHQPSLHSVTVDELQHMTQQHPYFAAAHFLLLKKMQDTEHPSFTDQLHRTTLYFNNPLWLQFLLQPETAAHFTVSDKAPFIENEPGEDREQNIALDQNADNIDTAVPTDEDRNEFPNGSPVQHHQQPQGNMMDIITEVFSEPDAIQEENIAVNLIDDTAAATDLLPIEDSNNNIADNIATVTDDTNTQHPPETQDLQSTAKKEEQLDNENGLNFISDNDTVAGESVEIPVAQPTDDIEQSTTHAEEGQPDLLPVSIENSKEDPAEQTTRDEPSMDIGAEEHDATEMPETTTAEENSGINDEKPLLRTIIETPAAANDLLFEPYHTVDYFASQGIKLGKQEADPKDKLGRQLKSFTDWLKTMKKLPQVSIDKILAENEESKVVEDAIHSIENKEVITEAMAEVFEKQGMNDKAAGIYQKLSLLNPSKSAYFAARIEALKH